MLSGDYAEGTFWQTAETADQSCEFIWQNCFHQTFWGITLICIRQKSPQASVQTYLQSGGRVFFFFF